MAKGKGHRLTITFEFGLVPEGERQSIEDEIADFVEDKIEASFGSASWTDYEFEYHEIELDSMTSILDTLNGE